MRYNMVFGTVRLEERPHCSFQLRKLTFFDALYGFFDDVLVPVFLLFGMSLSYTIMVSGLLWVLK